MTCKDNCLNYDTCVHQPQNKPCAMFKDKSRFAEQKYGKWEGVWNSGFLSQQRHCTICNWENHHCVDFKFCPNCGAKMDNK